MNSKNLSKANFSETSNLESRQSVDKDSLPAANRRALEEGNKPMLYSITSEGKIRLHRDLTKWRKPVGKTEYYETAQSPKEVSQEREFKALIARCTKEISLEQESAIAVKNMRKQEYLDGLAG